MASNTYTRNTHSNSNIQRHLPKTAMIAFDNVKLGMFALSGRELTRPGLPICRNFQN